jgi:hypothetical protein
MCLILYSLTSRCAGTAVPQARIAHLVHALMLLGLTGFIWRLLGGSTIATAAILLPDPRWQILLGWLAIRGWAAMIMHGMLTRIVPFLVCFHRYSPKLGFEPVPSMRSLLSQQRIKTGFWLHLASVFIGVTAIFTQMKLLAQLTGFMLVAVALSLASTLVHVLRNRQCLL